MDLSRDGQSMAIDSIALPLEHDGSGTLGCFLELQTPYSGSWHTVALTCWHVVVPPFSGLSPEDKKSSVTDDADVNRLLNVDHPTQRAYREQVTTMEEAIKTYEQRSSYKLFRQLEDEGMLEKLSSQTLESYAKSKSDQAKRKEDLQALRDRFKNGFQLLGKVPVASGFKYKNCGLKEDGKDCYTSLDWALFDSTHPLATKFATLSILQSLELHGEKVRMHGYRSMKTIGTYSGLRCANIETEITDGAVTTRPTREYSVASHGEQPFSATGDSGGMIGYPVTPEEGKESSIIGMVIAGFLKEGITISTRSDILLADIKEVTKAKNIKLWSPP
ncbi:uncharacterized protein N7483_012566 [Penicillium malachiteum]|uniref:uncharacterized protein n=1 Tax=Penicillium malachiteum TaxID=1324776 RepID=UPI0025471DF2|nr:uncharacterized protein N7483_012566 [Penicillium malachiteum]KAJ5715385.1 hypothetical protein N7483_012566 [Penicillium malachiteum]